MPPAPTKEHSSTTSTRKKRSAPSDESSSKASRKKSHQKCQKSIMPSGVLQGNELESAADAWTKRYDYSDDKLKIGIEPFRHCELDKFIENEDFLEDLVEKFDSFVLKEKASDLFQFMQSNDLKSYDDPHIEKIMEYLRTKVHSWLEKVTGLQLKPEIDLFMSEYRTYDFLLCHDDELDSRRIAFILYLNRDWKAEYGGNLDLFSATEIICNSAASDNMMHPNEIVKSIIPEFNKFAFFEVGKASFHQVSEVIKPNARRLALSGWYYGDPIPRPAVTLPSDIFYDYVENLQTKGENLLQHLCTKTYLDKELQKDINEQIAEESQVLIPGFLVSQAYEQICADIVQNDINGEFRKFGPANVCSFMEMGNGPPLFAPIKAPPPHIFKHLQQLFHSDEFLGFLEGVTEMPFKTSKSIYATSSLKKFCRGSYTLLRSGGSKQTGVKNIDADTRLAPSIDDFQHNQYSSSDSECQFSAGSSEKDHKNEVESDKQTEGDHADEEEQEEDPHLVDITYFIASNWDNSWGGLTVYCSENGEQLLTIPPAGNSLAIVARNSSVNSYVNYINSAAGEEVFFAYTITFDFKLGSSSENVDVHPEEPATVNH